MKVTGSARPESLWIRYTENGNVVMRLRKNIIQNDNHWTYDEVEVSLSERDHIKEYVYAHFEEVFQMGLLLENQPKELTEIEKIKADNEKTKLNIARNNAEMFETILMMLGG